MTAMLRLRAANAARRVVPGGAKRIARQVFPGDPRLRTSRRITTYNRRLLMNPVLAAAEERCDIGLSMGYPAWGLLYYSVLCSLPADGEVTIVETGTNLGFSTVVLAQALRDTGRVGTVHTVDVNREMIATAEQTVSDAGLGDKVVFHHGDSTRFLTTFGRPRSPVHFAFLDADHGYQSVMREFKAIRPAIVAGQGLIYFDNTSAGGVAKALRRIRRASGGGLIEFQGCSWSPPGNAIWQPPPRPRGR